MKLIFFKAFALLTLLGSTYFVSGCAPSSTTPISSTSLGVPTVEMKCNGDACIQ